MTGPYGPQQGGQPPFGQGGSQPYGQGGSQPYGQGAPQPYGPSGSQPYSPAGGQGYGQWGPGPGGPQGGPSSQGGYGQGFPGGGGAPGAQVGPRSYGPGQFGPGGYGQGGQGGQPNWQPGGQQTGGAPRAAARPPIDLKKILPLLIALLAFLALIFSFLTAVKVELDGTAGSVGNTWFVAGWVPALLLTAGVLALAPLLPNAGRHAFLVAVLSVGGALGALFVMLSLPSPSAVTSGYKAGAGLILLLIVGLLQAAAAVAAWLAEAGLLKARVAVPGAVASPVSSAGSGHGAAGPATDPRSPIMSKPDQTQSQSPHPPPSGSGQPGQGYGGYGSAAESSSVDQSFGGTHGYGSGSVGPSEGSSSGASGSSEPASYGSYGSPTDEPPTGSGASAGIGEAEHHPGEQPGRDDPGADVTQQVRF